ncbi:LysR family transcriptional regulator [Aquabacterium sp.]|uniref:LysR family transcriptional regulator n=1 Tax=Aquabacterium sp. TaxID=1872578 RepID=UPI002C335F6D|nr:LysR family transcriptional regulator [Aquabacterium sp.]HSW03122.1 LysR family transcriptional regulator [Aquabacterium sp.]
MNLFVSLKYLVALDDHRHFGRAALACHVTQPALSNALRALEESYGTAIVNRGRSFGGFTAEGERILASARRMLREQELLEQDLRSRADEPVGHLLIGAVPTAVPIAARFAARLQARHPGIRPSVRSMSSVELEARLEELALDMGLGYAERSEGSRAPLKLVPQYDEHYFLLRKAADPQVPGLRMALPMRWSDAAELPLCLLSPEMHNRSIVDRAFKAAGASATAAIETNSILTLGLSVLAGNVCSIMPGTLVGAVQGYAGLEAVPLMAPQVQVPVAFMVHDSNLPSRTLAAALVMAQEADWLQQARQHACAG